MGLLFCCILFPEKVSASVDGYITDNKIREVKR